MEEKIEIWKDITGYEGRYKISNLGRIKSVERIVERTSKKGKTFKCVFKSSFRKPHLNRDGYLYVSLCKKYTSKTAKIHRLVAQMFLNPVRNKNHVDHIDGNKLNNHISNLRWCTHAENIKYGWETGAYNNLGSRHGMSILKETDVLEIKRMLSLGKTNVEISKIYNVNKSTICDIKRGRTWKHL